MKKLFLSILKPKGIWASWLVFILLAAIVAAGVTGQFETLRQYLDTELLTFEVGNTRISAYTVLRALLVMALIFWSTAILSSIVENRVAKLSKVQVATRTLVTKIVQIALYIVAFLIAFELMGIDLTTLTVLGGALGIGLGFGLQKIASNFVSGLILLFERSMETGDLVELPDGTSGFVRRASARYTLIETLDGKEILIPNEDFITNRVTNWTLSNTRGRVEIPVGVSYGSDLDRAHALILEAAREHPMCIEDPAPQCFLRNFGDSSVDFLLLFWVAAVAQGRWAPQSDVMFAIWRKFRENGIEIPFPQRDLHIRSGAAQTGDADV